MYKGNVICSRKCGKSRLMISSQTSSFTYDEFIIIWYFYNNHSSPILYVDKWICILCSVRLYAGRFGTSLDTFFGLCLWSCRFILVRKYLWYFSLLESCWREVRNRTFQSGKIKILKRGMMSSEIVLWKWWPFMQCDQEKKGCPATCSQPFHCYYNPRSLAELRGTCLPT